MDYTVHGILQARIVEWVPFHFPGDLPNPGIELGSPALQEDSLQSEPTREVHDLNDYLCYLNSGSQSLYKLLSAFTKATWEHSVKEVIF